MCSSPKGRSTKPLLSSHVDSTSDNMSATEYSEMVHRANESYEHRQEALIEYRKTHKRKNSQNVNKQIKPSFFEKISAFFRQISSSHQLRSK